jgi:hypothetical protein
MRQLQYLTILKKIAVYLQSIVERKWIYDADVRAIRESGAC